MQHISYISIHQTCVTNSGVIVTCVLFVLSPDLSCDVSIALSEDHLRGLDTGYVDYFYSIYESHNEIIDFPWKFKQRYILKYYLKKTEQLGPSNT